MPRVVHPRPRYLAYEQRGPAAAGVLRCPLPVHGLALAPEFSTPRGQNMRLNCCISACFGFPGYYRGYVPRMLGHEATRMPRRELYRRCALAAMAAGSRPRVGTCA